MRLFLISYLLAIPFGIGGYFIGGQFSFISAFAFGMVAFLFFMGSQFWTGFMLRRDLPVRVVRRLGDYDEGRYNIEALYHGVWFPLGGLEGYSTDKALKEAFVKHRDQARLQRGPQVVEELSAADLK